MTYKEAMQAAEDARITQRRADSMLRDTARLLRGRLRVACVDNDTLRQLKKELAEFNMHTGVWKE